MNAKAEAIQIKFLRIAQIYCTYTNFFRSFR